MSVICEPAEPALVVCGTNAIIWPERCASVSKDWLLVTVYAVELPPVVIAPAISSRYFATAAIMARALSFTLDGACPSAQLIEPSALAFVAAVCDHFHRVMRRNL